MRTSKFDRKRKKVGGAAKLYGQIDRLIGAVEGKSTMRQLVIGTSIPEIVQIVEPLPVVSVLAHCGCLQLVRFLIKRRERCSLS